ncbi:MAG TPA: guanine deaminase [Devosia sp.]|nr:guanine deaminase [Devosia sp.]
MKKKLLRGRVLDFVAEPQSVEDSSAYRYFEDGAVLLSKGRIVASGDWGDVSAQVPEGCAVADHRPHLILPGLIDPHIHFVQMQVVASYAANLLEWLNTYTFVEEQKFADPEHGARIAGAFFDTLIRHGTTCAAAYCSVHPASAEAFFAQAEKRNMAVIGGKCMMDRNCPEALRDTPQRGYDETKALIEKWHGRGRANYAITPRFAITSSPEQMEMVGALAAEFPDVYVQTHLSENSDEIAFTMELYPEHTDYLEVYEHCGLLGHKSLFGHAIHLSEREIGAMAETGSVAVSCPTSNLFLGSGLFDHDRLNKAGVAIGVATDIGGGTSFSMFKTLEEFYKIQQLNGQRFDPLMSFYRMTLGNARALSLSEKIGTLGEGTEADIVVLDASATPEMALKYQTVSSLSEELFLLQTLGDDRAVVETYVAGEALKSGLT